MTDEPSPSSVPIPPEHSLQALIGVAASATAHRDTPTLLRDVATRLKEAVPFDFLGVVLHDPPSGVMRLTVFSASDPEQNRLGPHLSPLESPSGRVWQTQEPELIPDLAAVAAQYPSMRARWDEIGMRSAYYIPLSTPRRKLGTIFFGRREPHAYAPQELELFRFAAGQAAVAIDNALAAADIAKLRDELRDERDRLQLLLDVTQAVVAHLDLRGLFKAIAAGLRRVVPAEYVSLALYDPVRHGWDLHALDFPSSKGFLRESVRIQFDDAPASLAFTARKPASLDHDGLKRLAVRSTVARWLLDEGIHSWCCVPVLGRDRVLGTINVGREADLPFGASEVAWLERIAGPVGLAVENALAFNQIEELKNKLAAEKTYLEDEIRTEYGFAEIVGDNPGLRTVLSQVEIVAPADTTVLILGETGTGKELIARAIHRLSRRAERTFVKLNCAAIPTGLLESELFGHEKGAFTGAVARKAGRFELADGGTLFLDEVGDIPPDLQAKLLRVLQEQEFERLGGTKTIRVNVRLVAATNRDLTRMVSEGRFRADLFYRLNVFPVRLPPLRERTDDIAALARYFLQEYARKLNKRIVNIPETTLAAMTRYPWPGNVRELENLIERCVLLSPGPELRIPLQELSATASVVGPEAPQTAAARTLVEAEREHIIAVLKATGGKVGGPDGAAARLGMKRTTLQSKMKKLGVQGNDIAQR
jgi:formate hydrogenlyase transcriptional activator